MPNIEWDVAHDLVTPAGTIPLNQTDPVTGYRYQILSSGYEIIPTSLRGTNDNRSQADGAILHPRFKTGLVATMTVRYQFHPDPTLPDYTPACANDARLMHEALLGALDSIRILTTATQRLLWTPTGYGDRRMIDTVQCIAWPTPAFDESDNEITVTFSLETPFPYAIDLTQQVATVTTPLIITNPGNTPFIPVIKVYGATTAFTLVNSDDIDQFGNARTIVYDGAVYGSAFNIPGGGQYAAIDTFKGSIFLNGSGADLTGGLDPTTTDFFRLLPGTNTITLTGAPSADILWNPSWA